MMPDATPVRVDSPRRPSEGRVTPPTGYPCPAKRLPDPIECGRETRVGWYGAC